MRNGNSAKANAAFAAAIKPCRDLRPLTAGQLRAAISDVPNDALVTIVSISRKHRYDRTTVRGVDVQTMPDDSKRVVIEVEG